MTSPVSISEYRANSNAFPGDQDSNKSLLARPIGARRVIVGIASTLLIQFPSIFRWILIRNNGVDSIWFNNNVPAVVGIGIEIVPGSNYFVSPIPPNTIFAISENAQNNRISVSEF